MRPDTDHYFIEMCQVVAKRSTCHRRSVGCILTDKYNFILASGYNGVASGLPHCKNGELCSGALSPSGTNLIGCKALHAEENALIQCRDITSIVTCYTTTSPCLNCVSLLLNTSCQRIVFLEQYPHMESKSLWLRQGRIWTQIQL